METVLTIIPVLGAFAIIALAAKQVGLMSLRGGLPLISGFLLTGILAGPHVLDLVSESAVARLKFVDEIALGFIAFAAGGELYLREMRSSFRSIAWVTLGLVTSTFFIGSLCFYFLSAYLPFMSGMPFAGRIGVSILAGTILVARSPSSAIAIVNELRAKGPFTQTVLGVTVIMDMVVISLFAVNSSITDALFSGLRVSPGFLLLLCLELSVSFAAGLAVGKLLQFILFLNLPENGKSALILGTGFSVFLASGWIHHASEGMTGVTILLEPLLICMIAGFFVGNYSRHRIEFLALLSKMGPMVYIAFFTLTGASLALDTLALVWPVTLVLFLVRCTGIFIGSFTGGLAAKNPFRHNRVAWMAYITQAGVGLGLAREVVVEYPAWGDPFAAVMISVIILNQLIGPPLFKRAIKSVGEDRTRAQRPEGLEGQREAVIFGLDRQSVALANMLDTHGWQVRIAALQDGDPPDPDNPGQMIPVKRVPDLTRASLEQVRAARAGAIVGMLSDEENYRICELAFRHFGTETLIVRLNRRENFSRFNGLGVLVVEPGTAIVSLLDQMVRSPSAAAMLLGMGRHQDVHDLEMRNPDLDNLPLRDLRLPIDTIIISIRRDRETLVPHGHARLRLGDRLSICGSLKSLEEVALRFDIHKPHALVHMVEKVRNSRLSDRSLAPEVNRIISRENPMPEDRFDRFAKSCIILDVTRKTNRDAFFRTVSGMLSQRLDMPAEHLFDQLTEREAGESTVISPGLAVPHIIIEGEGKFMMLLARSRPGIRFSEAAPAVHAVFVLVGTRDERNFHLHALSAIAQIALDPHFENKWLRAGTKEELRELIVYANRKRA